LAGTVAFAVRIAVTGPIGGLKLLECAFGQFARAILFLVPGAVAGLIGRENQRGAAQKYNQHHGNGSFLHGFSPLLALFLQGWKSGNGGVLVARIYAGEIQMVTNILEDRQKYMQLNPMLTLC